MFWKLNRCLKLQNIIKNRLCYFSNCATGLHSRNQKKKKLNLRKPSSAISYFKLLTSYFYVKNNKTPYQAYARRLVGQFLTSNFYLLTSNFDVRMLARMCPCMHACMRVDTNVCLSVCLSVCLNVSMYICVYVKMRVLLEHSAHVVEHIRLYWHRNPGSM